jgi:hypothetical protein
MPKPKPVVSVTTDPKPTEIKNALPTPSPKYSKTMGETTAIVSSETDTLTPESDVTDAEPEADVTDAAPEADVTEAAPSADVTESGSNPLKNGDKEPTLQTKEPKDAANDFPPLESNIDKLLGNATFVAMFALSLALLV